MKRAETYNWIALAKRLFAYRVKNDLSMSAMAQLARVSIPTIMRAERGEPTLSRMTIAKIEAAIKE